MNFSILSVSCLVAFGLGTNAMSAQELAKVNGKVIQEKDLGLALGGFNETQRDQILKDPASRKQLIQSVIDQEVLYQEAEKAQLTNSPEYKDALETFRKQFLANLLIQKKIGPKLTDKEAKDYFSKNKNRYSTDQVRAQHILLDSEEKAREILSQAKAAGADFQKLAEKNSKDPSAKNNRGDLGFFTRDRMVPEFSDVAFRAKEGEIVGPVKTSFGYHIIKVVERKSGKPQEFAEVELQVKGALRQEAIKELVEEYKKTAKIEVSAIK